MRVRAFGAVLAGGRARRLDGVDKALLDLGEGPLLGRILALLEPRTTGIAVIGEADRPVGFGVPVLPDLREDCGPLGGLEAALDSADAPHVLVVACDLPFVGERLLDALLGVPEGPDVVVPCIGGLYEPLCARYATRLLPAVRSALDAGTRKMIDLYRGREVVGLDVAAQGIPAEELFNINRPEDLARARRLAAERRGIGC